jgi:hypothetical protein
MVLSPVDKSAWKGMEMLESGWILSTLAGRFRQRVEELTGLTIGCRARTRAVVNFR